MIAFGPISSRRLGKSLGINNIVAQKICSYSCVYCQIGHTKNKICLRQAFYNPDVLIKEVETHLNRIDREHMPDYLTFVSNGEPTLDMNLGMEIRSLKKFNIPVAVITNSSLLHDKHVQADLMEADWVSLKIDAITPDTWKKINRPADELNFDGIFEGIKSFVINYKGQLNTETMLIKDYNDSTIELKKMASFIAILKPAKAYISIPIRPPAIKEIESVNEKFLNSVWQIFHKEHIQTEFLTGFEGKKTGFTGNAIEDILNITAVHPLREDTMDELLKQEKTDHSLIDTLVMQDLIKVINYNGKKYYVRSLS
jgi:wyosine [tRNA(Phe)-imidazoG37] synthetase (radical SAM superfamily)